MELLDAPTDLSMANTASGFQISVQMTSSDVGPYACLVFHDPVATALTVGELQQQFSGPYSDFTASQVIIPMAGQPYSLYNRTNYIFTFALASRLLVLRWWSVWRFTPCRFTIFS